MKVELAHPKMEGTKKVRKSYGKLEGSDINLTIDK